MKFLIFFLSFSVCGYLNAQTKRLSISEKQIGGVNCKYYKSIDLDKIDTVAYVYLGFQNAKYSTISDIVSIFFELTTDSTDIFDFIKDLKTALPEMGNKSSIAWNKKGTL